MDLYAFSGLVMRKNGDQLATTTILGMVKAESIDEARSIGFRVLESSYPRNAGFINHHVNALRADSDPVKITDKLTG